MTSGKNRTSNLDDILGIPKFTFTEGMCRHCLCRKCKYSCTRCLFETALSCSIKTCVATCTAFTEFKGKEETND